MTASPDPSKVSYKVKELVKATGLSRTTIYALITSGELPSFKFHGNRLVLRSEIEAMFAKAVGADGGLHGPEGPKPR
jgi:excisionase family DNA binding protein